MTRRLCGPFQPSHSEPRLPPLGLKTGVISSFPLVDKLEGHDKQALPGTGDCLRVSMERGRKLRLGTGSGSVPRPPPRVPGGLATSRGRHTPRQPATGCCPRCGSRRQASARWGLVSEPRSRQHRPAEAATGGEPAGPKAPAGPWDAGHSRPSL